MNLCQLKLPDRMPLRWLSAAEFALRFTTGEATNSWSLCILGSGYHDCRRGRPASVSLWCEDSLLHTLCRTCNELNLLLQHEVLTEPKAGNKNQGDGRQFLRDFV